MWPHFSEVSHMNVCDKFSPLGALPRAENLVRDKVSSRYFYVRVNVGFRRLPHEAQT